MPKHKIPRLKFVTYKRRRDDIEFIKLRFMRFVQKLETGCWYWTGSKLQYGYGAFSFRGKTCRAHRVGWFLFKGIEPSDFLLHQCDNTWCVNPDHLKDGSQLENMAECIARGRLPQARRNSLCRL